MDFITHLPLSRGFNAVFTCVDRLTKLCHLTPCFVGPEQPTGAGETAAMFFDAVVCHYGVPEYIVHDRDPRFTSDFWKALWRLLGTRTLLSTAHHPQTDGQTERHHRSIE